MRYFICVMQYNVMIVKATMYVAFWLASYLLGALHYHISASAKSSSTF